MNTPYTYIKKASLFQKISAAIMISFIVLFGYFVFAGEAENKTGDKTNPAKSDSTAWAVTMPVRYFAKKTRRAMGMEEEPEEEKPGYLTRFGRWCVDYKWWLGGAGAAGVYVWGAYKNGSAKSWAEGITMDDVKNNIKGKYEKIKNFQWSSETDDQEE